MKALLLSIVMMVGATALAKVNICNYEPKGNDIEIQTHETLRAGSAPFLSGDTCKRLSAVKFKCVRGHLTRSRYGVKLHRKGQVVKCSKGFRSMPK